MSLQHDEWVMAAGIGNDNMKGANRQMRTDHIYRVVKKHDNPFENEHEEINVKRSSKSITGWLTIV